MTVWTADHTNLDLVNHLMTHGTHGACSEAFVIDAIYQHACRVSQLDPDAIASRAMLSNQAWVETAQEIKATMDEFYGWHSSRSQESDQPETGPDS